MTPAGGGQLRAWRAEVIGRYPHPGRGFTHGLVAGTGSARQVAVWESSGRSGQSALCGGKIWANVAGAPLLAGIDLDSGEVTDVADARAAREWRPGDDQAIMNGIAALPAAGEFLLTGKTYRYICHVRLVPARGRAGRRDTSRLTGAERLRQQAGPSIGSAQDPERSTTDSFWRASLCRR